MSISMTGLILCIGTYPCILLMYVLLKNEAQSGKGIYYGVTIPKEYRKEPELQTITEEYNRQMKRCLWWMLLLPLPSLFLPWESIVVAVWMIWIAISIFIFFVPFGIANEKLKEVKREKKWSVEAVTDTEVELKSAGMIRRVKWYHFLPPCVISVILPVWVAVGDFGPRREPLFIMELTFAGISFLFWAVALWQDRGKTQIISCDSDVNVNYNRAKKNVFKTLWVSCVWINVAYMIWMLFCVDEWGGFTKMFWWATVVYAVGTLIPVIWMGKKMVALDKRYEANRNKVTSADNDENWIWGMMYYNPKDRRAMVNKRVGVGTTINMATKGGKATILFLVLTILSFPIISIWVIMLEFTPIQLITDGNQIVANHLREECTISMPAIEEVELLSELPKMSRNSGTAMENLRKGSWSVREEGNCSVFLDPRNELFLRIETPSSRYYLSGVSDAETQAVYDAVVSWQQSVEEK